MRRLIIVTTVSFSFMCVEAVGGYMANSLAILTDAARINYNFYFFRYFHIIFPNFNLRSSIRCRRIFNVNYIYLDDIFSSKKI